MATGATEHIDVMTAASFIPEIWSRFVQRARENTLVFAKLVNRQFEADANFGDTIHVPVVSNLSATSKDTSANAAISYETVTETTVDITIGTWEYSAIAQETATRKQTYKNLLELYGPKMAYALGLAVDNVLAGLVDDFSNSVGTLAVEASYEDMLRAQQYLDDADAPVDGRSIVIAPAQRAGFMKLDQWVHADYASLRSGNGDGREMLGRWMDVPVYMSVNVEGTNAAGHDNAFMHREALALVMQIKPRTHTQFDIDYLADKIVVEQLYGTKEMRDDHGVFVKGA